MAMLARVYFNQGGIVWPFKKKVSAPKERFQRWKLAKETFNYAQIELCDEPQIQWFDELLDAGFEVVHVQRNGDGSLFICRKTSAADFKKLRQY